MQIKNLLYVWRQKQSSFKHDTWLLKMSLKQIVFKALCLPLMESRFIYNECVTKSWINCIDWKWVQYTVMPRSWWDLKLVNLLVGVLAFDTMILVKNTSIVNCNFNLKEISIKINTFVRKLSINTKQDAQTIETVHSVAHQNVNYSHFWQIHLYPHLDSKFRTIISRSTLIPFLRLPLTKFWSASLLFSLNRMMPFSLRPTSRVCISGRIFLPRGFLGEFRGMNLPIKSNKFGQI